MNRYPTEALSVRNLLKLSIRLHYVTLKQVIACVLVITIVKYFCVLLGKLYPVIASQLIISGVAIILTIYFFAAALLAAHRAFIDHPISVGEAIKTIGRKSVKIYTTFFAYFFGTMAVYFFAKFSAMRILKLLHMQTTSSPGVILYMAFLCMLFLALFYFSFPITVIDDKPVHKAFYESALLTEKNKLGILLSVCIFFMAYVLMMPKMLHEHFLVVYHLSALFDFVVLCVSIPLYINLLLLLMNDSKQQ